MPMMCAASLPPLSERPGVSTTCILSSSTRPNSIALAEVVSIVTDSTSALILNLLSLPVLRNLWSTSALHKVDFPVPVFPITTRQVASEHESALVSSPFASSVSFLYPMCSKRMFASYA